MTAKTSRVRANARRGCRSLLLRARRAPHGERTAAMTVTSSLLACSARATRRVRLARCVAAFPAARPPQTPAPTPAATRRKCCALVRWATSARATTRRGVVSRAGAAPGDAADDKTSRVRGEPSQYPEYYLDMGPRIRKVYPDDPSFEPTDWDVICDVRSPSEWAEDHVPLSISAPVLDDDERARVGTIYKRESPFLAKKVGASLVAKNLSKIIDAHFAHREKDTKVLVYCWRGGERSLSLAHVLSRIGFTVGIVPGGYKRYRAGVLEFLRSMDGFRYHLVAGKTGCAKGKMLETLEAQGAQVLDLEVMAQHRGSVLGEDPETKFSQPSQKAFDTRLWEKARTFDRTRPIFVDGESSMIGKVQIPKNTWKGMRAGTVTLLEVPMASRVKWIRAGYTHFETTEVPRLIEKLNVLVQKVGRKKVEEWEEMVAAERWDEFVEDILVNHYDSAYGEAAKRSGRDDAAAEFLMLPDTEDETYAAAAAELIRKYDVSVPAAEAEAVETETETEAEAASAPAR